MNHSRGRSLTAALALLVLSACGVPEGDLPPPGPSLGDWTEAVRIGRLEGSDEEVFGNIRSAVLLERGGVVILDDQGARAIGFDDRGTHAFTLGRRGQGPGEFVDPSALFRISDDTLAFLNRSVRTLQLFAKQHPTDTFREIGRHELPFWPSSGCSMRGRIFILGGYEDRAVHEVDREGAVLNSFPASDYADEAAEGAPEAIAWDLRDQAQSGLLVCSEASGHVMHVPRRLGWGRAYTAAGDLAWHSSFPDFVKGMVVPAAGGVAIKYEFDPDFNFSYAVVGAAPVADTHLAVSISVSVPRGQEPEVEGLLALLDLATGAQTRRDESGAVVVSGLGERIAVVYREPFPTLAILQRGEW
ncbi:hypothetical protein [Candidatus Palauibacter sp.]|uniref:hypothetical protein n=1 Tax=Candidatus Palauibacter sp. TaxID=3101350 RepID=UPI003AF1FFEE